MDNAEALRNVLEFAHYVCANKEEKKRALNDLDLSDEDLEQSLEVVEWIYDHEI